MRRFLGIYSAIVAIFIYLYTIFPDGCEAGWKCRGASYLLFHYKL